MTLTDSCFGPQSSVKGSGVSPAAMSDGMSASRAYVLLADRSDPLVLKEIVFNLRGKRIIDGKLLNNANTAVISYQLALAIGDKFGHNVEIVRGPLVDSTLPIVPHEERGIVPIPLNDFAASLEYGAIGVFVLQVEFAGGGTWKADVPAMTNQIEDVVSADSNSGERKPACLAPSVTRPGTLAAEVTQASE